MSTRRGVPGSVIRDALTQLLARQTEPASVRDLVTAVYHLTGDDQVSYGNVHGDRTPVKSMYPPEFWDLAARHRRTVS